MCIMSGRKRTILQVTKCTGTPSQMLFAKGSSDRVWFKKFLKTPILEKLLSDTDLQIKFHKLKFLMKIEA